MNQWSECIMRTCSDGDAGDGEIGDGDGGDGEGGDDMGGDGNDNGDDDWKKGLMECMHYENCISFWNSILHNLTLAIHSHNTSIIANINSWWLYAIGSNHHTMVTVILYIWNSYSKAFPCTANTVVEFAYTWQNTTSSEQYTNLITQGGSRTMTADHWVVVFSSALIYQNTGWASKQHEWSYI